MLENIEKRWLYLPITLFYINLYAQQQSALGFFLFIISAFFLLLSLIIADMAKIDKTGKSYISTSKVKEFGLILKIIIYIMFAFGIFSIIHMLDKTIASFPNEYLITLSTLTIVMFILNIITRAIPSLKDMFKGN